MLQKKIGSKYVSRFPFFVKKFLAAFERVIDPGYGPGMVLYEMILRKRKKTVVLHRRGIIVLSEYSNLHGI